MAWEGNSRTMTPAEWAHWEAQAAALVRRLKGAGRMELTACLESLARSMREGGTPAPARAEWGAIQKTLNAVEGLDGETAP